MSDFSKKPQELALIPVEKPTDDACEGCYYYAETQACEYPCGNPWLECTDISGENDNHDLIFVEVD